MRGPDPDEPGYVQGTTGIRWSTSRPQVFVQRRTEPGWHFRTKDGKYVHDGEGRQGHLYTHPYPVSDREFLVSYKVNPADHYKEVANAYALYLIDTEGRHRLVHADAKLSCWHPLPLVARPVPPLVQPFRDPQYAASNQAVCVVANVYQGMEGVEPGKVKWLRINEALPRYWSTGRRWEPSLSSSSWKAALWPRVQWGVVPVEKDGSAHFRRAGQSQHLLPGPGRELPGTPARADLRELRARRGAFLHGLPRAIPPHRRAGAPPPRRSR